MGRAELRWRESIGLEGPGSNWCNRSRIWSAMSDDLYELQRERERDSQRELDSKQLDRELFKLTLDAKRTQLETGLLQRRLDAPMADRSVRTFCSGVRSCYRR